ncbi:MAG: hypothetical protein JW797_18550 [Bradymonadales bacterium]|nr:hypothetical protein [Bradymonadales bacterium]
MTVLELIEWLNLYAEHEAEVVVLGQVEKDDEGFEFEVGTADSPFELQFDEESKEVLLILPKIDLSPRRFR